MAEPAEHIGTTIEALFGPTTRFRGRLRGPMTEQVELLQDLTLGNVLTTGITWEDFCLFCRNKIVWMTRDVYVYNGSIISHPGYELVAKLGSLNRLGLNLRVYAARSGPETVASATATCNFLLHILATSELPSVNMHVRRPFSAIPPPLSGTGLSLFFQESRSCLHRVTLSMVLSEDHCRALTTMSRLDVNIVMYHCSLSNGADGAFVECLQSDSGPVELIQCRIDSQILASALTGNSRVTTFKPGDDSGRTNDTNMAVLFTALANNRGLLNFLLGRCSISNDNWSVLCESLQAHPTLTSLNLIAATALSTDQRAQRTRAIAEMMHHNTVLRTIPVSDGYFNQQIFAEMILPFLETNRYRPRVLAITQADIQLRRPFLGRALQTDSIRNKSNLLWMFLSENPDVVVLSNDDDDEEVAEAGSGNWASGGSK